MSFKYSDGIAAAHTMIALEGNANALQRRLPKRQVSPANVATRDSLTSRVPSRSRHAA